MSCWKNEDPDIIKLYANRLGKNVCERRIFMRRRCRNRYQCRINLKMLRKSFGITQQEIADRLYYSVRTVERFEKENATTNEETAKVLAEIYGINFKEDFVCVDQSYIDERKKLWSLYSGICKSNQRILDDEYYFIYVYKVDFNQKCVMGKGMWLREYTQNKEVRVLRPANASFFSKKFPDAIIINSKMEWQYLYEAMTIGKMYRILISKECIQKCLPECLEKTIVRKDNLYWIDGYSDIMFWGQEGQTLYK